jgi:hypothetical protein
MALEENTFPCVDGGADNNPDFYSGPNAIGADEVAVVKGGDTPAVVDKDNWTWTGWFKRRPKSDKEKLDEFVKANKATFLALQAKAETASLNSAEAQEFLYLQSKVDEALYKWA